MGTTTSKQKKALKTITLDEAIEYHYGKRGTPKREAFEVGFQKDLIGTLIKQLRQGQKYTRAELAKILEIDKSQVAKIEDKLSSMRTDALLKLLKTLRAEATIKPDMPKTR